jgi:rod shape determining protein RodA
MTVLIGIGLFCSKQAFHLSDDNEAIFLKQLAGIFVGYVIIICMQFIDYHIISTLSCLFYIVMVSVLGFTLIFSSNINDVKRWIMIMGIPFQPSELTKVALIIFLAFLCNFFKNKLDKLYVLFILGVVAGLPIVLILLEPHLSSSLAILFIFCIIVYSSGISYKVIGKAFALILPLILVVFIGVTQFNINTFYPKVSDKPDFIF